MMLEKQQPHIPISLPSTPSKSDIQILLSYLPSYSNNPSYTQFKISKLNGLSNNIYKVNNLVVKIYLFPKDTKKEEILLTYSGIDLIATFNNGRIERFEKNEEFDMRVYKSEIAAKLRSFHSLKFEFDTKSIWNLFDDYLAYLDSSSLISSKKIKIKKYIEKIKKNKYEMMFCHNDLQQGNIFLSNNSIKFIDFEYSCMNYRGFEICNHFYEYCFDYNKIGSDGGKNDYVDFGLFPSLEEQKEFIGYYCSNTTDDEDNCSEDVVLEEVLYFKGLVNLFWGLWGMVQVQSGVKEAESEAKEFDYLAYAQLRLDEWERVIL